jgi:hypothetical protein
MKTQRTRGPGGERDRARWRRAALSLATSGMVALTAACAQPATTPPTTSRRATATTSPTAPTAHPHRSCQDDYHLPGFGQPELVARD